MLTDSAHRPGAQGMRGPTMAGALVYGSCRGGGVVKAQRVQLVVAHQERCVSGVHHAADQLERRGNVWAAVNHIANKYSVTSCRRPKASAMHGVAKALQQLFQVPDMPVDVTNEIYSCISHRQPEYCRGMRIVFATHTAEENPDLLAELGGRHPKLDIVQAESSEPDPELPAAEVLVSGPLSDSQLAAAESLQCHIIPFTGIDRVQTNEYGRRGISVLNSHGNATTVAERALALLLALSGRVIEFDARLRTGNWSRRNNPGSPFELWRSLRNLRIGLLGTGAIGRAFAGLLQPFGSPIRGCNRGGSPAPGIPDVTPDVVALAEWSDALVVSLPLTGATQDLVDARVLSALGRHGLLVNVGRGKVVEEHALYRALRDQTISGAALDVWYQYPRPFWTDSQPSELPFTELPNLVCSPHAGSHTAEGKRDQLVGALESLEAWLSGDASGHSVDLEAGY